MLFRSPESPSSVEFPGRLPVRNPIKCQTQKTWNTSVRVSTKRGPQFVIFQSVRGEGLKLCVCVLACACVCSLVLCVCVFLRQHDNRKQSPISTSPLERRARTTTLVPMAIRCVFGAGLHVIHTIVKRLKQPGIDTSCLEVLR